jgi:hypothetical protein
MSPGDWVLRGERPPQEIALALVGRFGVWSSSWRRFDIGGFGDLAQPGFAKAMCA